MKGLSKSRYTKFCQCPKALWLTVYKSEEAVIDETQQTRLEQGNIVGDLAMGLFGDFKKVTTMRDDGSLNLLQMMALTKQYMQEGVENICEASFSYQGCYCAVDILRRNDDGWAIYEVKSTSFSESKDSKSKLEKYAPDIAYQKWVLEQCGVNVTATHLVCLNSDYERQGELDLQQLFAIIDISELVDKEHQKVPVFAEEAQKVISVETEPDKDLGEHCFKPYRCDFFDYCKRQHGLPTPSVFDVYGGSNACKK